MEGLQFIAHKCLPSDCELTFPEDGDGGTNENEDTSTHDLPPAPEIHESPPTAKRKPQKKKVTMDPTPIRPPVKIYNEKNEPVQLVFRNADLKVSNCFQNDRNRRQDSHARFTGGYTGEHGR